MISRIYLVNLYDSQVQASFEDADSLVSYLREKNKNGTLMGREAFAIFFGQQMSTSSYWESALKNEIEI